MSNATAAEPVDGSQSTTSGFRSPGPYLKRHVTYTVNRDGTYVKEWESVGRADNEAGVREWSAVRVPYSSSLQKAEVLEAYVQTPSGERIDVPAHKIFTQEPYMSQGAPEYSDYQVKSIVFPKVVPGTVVGTKVRVTQHIPVFPGQFNAVEMMSPHHEWLDTRFTVIAPADMPMKVQGDGAEVVRSELPDGRVQWVMNARRQTAVAREAGSVATIDYSVRFTATTFDSASSLASAYRSLIGDVAHPTSKVIALADRLTRGIDERRDQAKALYDWLRLDIRYVYIGLGNGGYVPHDPDSVIDNAYGDCKDKATLLVALLKAKGIDSTPVLINMGMSYWVPSSPALAAFNHMIVYIPSLDRYVDPTATHASFETLPREDSAKSVIHVDDGRSARTPMRTSAQDGVVIDGHFRYAGDGTLDARFDALARGNVAFRLRGGFAAIATSAESELIKYTLASAGLKGDGRFRRPDLKGTGETSAYGFDLKTSSAADFPGPGSLTLPASLLNGGVAANLAALAEPGELPMSCQPLSIEERLLVELPEKVTALRMPPDADEHGSNASFDVRYVATSRTVPAGVEMHRSFTFEPRSPVCSAGDMGALQEMAVRVQKNLRTPIGY